MATKSAIVSGMGLAMSIVTSLMKAVEKRGGTDEDVHRLATPEGENLLVQIADLIVGSTRQAFKVVVDYTKSLAEMIEAGKYDWKNSDITQEHFPVQGQGREEKDVVLFHFGRYIFGRYISSEDAIAEMAKAGYCPAQIQELLALGAANPELQKQFPIVALGSAWQSPDGNRGVPYLFWSVRERDLDLSWFEFDWDEDYRFAAVRK